MRVTGRADEPVMEVLGRALLVLVVCIAAPARWLWFTRRISRDVSLRVGILVGVLCLLGIGLTWAGGGL